VYYLSQSRTLRPRVVSFALPPPAVLKTDIFSRATSAKRTKASADKSGADKSSPEVAGPFTSLAVITQRAENPDDLHRHKVSVDVQRHEVAFDEGPQNNRNQN
jgi:hypothetical protein